MDRIASTVSVFALLAASGLAFAQHTDGVTLSEEAAPSDRAGWLALGDALFTPENISVLTGDTGNLGVEFAFGYYWVTHNGDFATGTQVLNQYDSDWNLVESYLQLTNSPMWGQRDGAAIESENRLFFGAESGELCEYVFDPGTQRLDLGASQIIASGSLGTVRALAWDPNNEVFYTKDFSGTIEFLDRDGFLIDLAAATPSAYGAAFDPVNGTVWFNAYIDTALGTTAPNTRLVEWDPATRALTGREFDTEGSSPSSTIVYHIPGGLDIHTEGDCTYAIAMNQGGEDTGAADPTDIDFVNFWEIAGDCGGGGCRVDLDGDGELTLFDFLTFSNLFDSGDLTADFDGDGSLTLFDFLTFSNEFDAGC
ncbi:MAG: GC-type dockerin domain-anchored protein [Phycisphaerales bacterium JB060]